MNFVKRAMCYVRRKSGKSVLLFFLFLVADITILGTLAILDTSSGINDEIRRQTNAKVVIENLEVNRSLTEQDYRKLLDIASINSMNRMAKCILYPNGFAPITGADESEIGQVCLIGFDDMEKDSPFTENIQAKVLPVGTNLPMFESYDGTINPVDHLVQFENTMLLHNLSDAMYCKAFATTLKSTART